MLSSATKGDAPRRLRAGAAGERRAGSLPVRAIDRGGALTTADGAVVRVLELTPLGALAATAQLGEELLDGVAALLGELAPGEALQWYDESRRLDDGGAQRGSFVVIRTPAGRAARLARAGAARGPLGSAHARACEQSLARAERLARRLAALGLRPRLLDGPGVSRLLLRRLGGAAAPSAERRVEVVGSLDERADAQRSIAAAARLLQLLRGAVVHFRDDRRVTVGTTLEQVVSVAGAPAGGVRDWLAPLRASAQPYVLSVHARACEDGMLELTAHQALREPGPRPDAVRLATAVDDAVGAAAAADGVRIDRGEFAQRTLWPATLPLGLDAGQLGQRVEAHVAAAALPLFADRCGSPAGIAFGRGAHGRTERLDPWDVAHRHAGVIVAGGSTRERGLALLAIAGRLAERGAAVVALDLEGALTATPEQLAPLRLAAAEPADLAPAAAPAADGDLARTGERPPFVVADAQGATRLLPLAGAASALLAQLTADDDPGAADDAPAATGRGALLIAGGERLLREPGAALWLQRTCARARRDGCCVVLGGVELASLDAAGLLAVAPVRVLLGHPPRAAAALGERLRLAPAETRAIVSARDGETPDAPVALWLNGDRGRALVRVLELPLASAREDA